MSRAPAAGVNSRKAPVNSAKAGGRPSRQEELRREIEAGTLDPDLVDPRRILASIAADITAPAGARVLAAKALIVANKIVPDQPDEPKPAEELDELTRRALSIMNHGRVN